MAEINIDATGLIVGRLGAYVAHQAMLGHNINIFNSEKAVMTGSKKVIVARYHHRIAETGLNESEAYAHMSNMLQLEQTLVTGVVWKVSGWFEI